MSSMNDILAVMPPPGDPLTVEDVFKLAIRTDPKMTKRRVVKFLAALVNREMVDKPETNQFILNKSGLEFREAGRKITSGPTKPHSGPRKHIAGTVRGAVWKVLREGNKTTIPEIESLIDDESRSHASNIGKYLNILKKAGYVKVMPKREQGFALTSNGFNRYLLIKNTGPLNPIWSAKLGGVYDRNLSEMVWKEDEVKQ
ncbi:MAG: hypothetical protein OQJ97_18635 [Rhodospirillales bacterium]|nr:hypothetical protein [Rhodospirillales bacterium]